MPYNVTELLTKAAEIKASDVHFTVGMPPIFRVRGDLSHAGQERLTEDDTERIALDLMDDNKKAIFRDKGEVDFSYAIKNFCRFRVNVYRQRKSCTVALRIIYYEIPSIDSLGLPEVLKDLAMKPRGLFLVTGPTGSGKSTTLAAMVGYINTHRACHVLTIEEPIEYLHRHGKCMINQREVGDDTQSFANALRAALREDPDVILVGEMRDLETISTAVSASETGHFVMSTLHTTSAAQTVDRIIDVFPPYQQPQIKSQLAAVLQGIICQQLVPTRDKTGRVAAMEILVVNDAVRNLIREGKNFQINTVLQTNIKNGMAPMDYSLAKLVKSGIITPEEAHSRCVDRDLLKNYLTQL